MSRSKSLVPGGGARNCSRMLPRLMVVALMALPQLGCGDDISVSTAVDIPDACNPLGGLACLVPWPSAAYLTEANTPTGVRLDLPVEAMPRNFQDIPIDPAPYNRFDGFSPTGPMVALFPTGVSAEGLPGHREPAASLRDDSATIVLEMATGRRIVHFAEVDENVLFAEERALIIRPLERLVSGSRYAVAIRRSVKAEDGSDLPVPAAFEALVAGRGDSVKHPLMESLAPRYDEIFSALESAGIDRNELVLAWDFVTASDEMLTGDLMTMRNQAMPALTAELEFTASELPSDPVTTLRMLEGTHQAPNFLSNGEEEDSVLVRGAAGEPTLDGMYDANFAAVVPACVAEAGTELPIPVVLFGHGLFGSGSEYVMDDLLPTIANQFCVVVVAGDFIGLTSRQVAVAARAANDVNTLDRLVDKLAQSVINFIALSHMVRGPFASDSHFQLAGQPILDSERVFYLGASLGGIMGNTFMAYEPFITRGVLGVPGGAWSLLLERSLAAGLILPVAKASYRDHLASLQVLTSLLAMRLEPYDPITTAHRVIGDPLPDTPAKELLLYEAIGDSLVSNLSTEMTARTMGIPVLEPSIKLPYGLEGRSGPLTSGLVIYDEHRTPLPPETNMPPSEDNGTHGGVNEREAVLRQVSGFLLEGRIVSQCLDEESNPAPCDCSTGVCD